MYYRALDPLEIAHFLIIGALFGAIVFGEIRRLVERRRERRLARRMMLTDANLRAFTFGAIYGTRDHER